MPEQRDLNAPIGAASPAGATGSWWLLGVRMSSSSADAIAAACTTPHGQGARPALVACVNVHSLAVASRDGQFSAALDAATYVTADGAPVRAAGRLLREPVGPRVTGYDVFERAMTRLDGRGGRALFVGATPGVLETIRSKASRDYPRVTVDVLAPPYGDLAGEPTDRIIARVDAFRPDVVFLGMSAPKQETWAAQNAAAIHAIAVVCIGAVFDYYAGTRRRAPAWMRWIGCEWCYRLLQEPRRLWRRYFVSGPTFARLVWNEWRDRRWPPASAGQLPDAALHRPIDGLERLESGRR